MSATGDILRPACPRGGNGFTLLETLVTLGIAALVAGIAFPAVQRSLDAWNQRAAVASVRSALAEARSLALRTASQVRFLLAPRGDGFSVGGGGPVSLPPSARLSGTASTIIFYPDGSASGGRLAVRSGARQTVLLVSPVTGLASLDR